MIFPNKPERSTSNLFVHHYRNIMSNVKQIRPIAILRIVHCSNKKEDKKQVSSLLTLTNQLFCYVSCSIVIKGLLIPEQLSLIGTFCIFTSSLLS